MVHEAALAAKEATVDDKAFFKFLTSLFVNQEEFFDVNCWNKTRQEIYDRLIELAKESGLDGDKINTYLQMDPDGVKQGYKNPGSLVTPQLKVAVKLHRKRGVHVSPTVFVNGIEASDISSSWSVEQWKKYLENKV